MKKFFIFFLLYISIFFISCSSNNYTLPAKNTIEIHYIDVGQGDSILIRVNDKNMIIDSGPKDSRKDLLKYLDNLNINSIDYLIATHPHEDHIGNMNSIITKYKIGKFYSPKVYDTSKDFELMVEALNEKNIKINIINTKIRSLNLGDNTEITIFSPIKDETFDNLNNYSPLIKVVYGKTSFLFTGDCEKAVEAKVLKKYKTLLQSDVLKVGHHGSSTSTSKDFLLAVNPKIAIISSGKDNPFDHPHKETIELLKEFNVHFFNTAKDKTIVLISNGEIVFKK